MYTKNNRFLKAIAHEPVDRTPIWLMRQAGRYLPEYQATRKEAGSFLALCKNPALACEVTLQPLRRFDLDAAIIFSDILTIPDAMGLGLQFIEGKGPHFDHPLRSRKAIEDLQVPDLSTLGYVYEAIKLVQKSLANSLPLIGFCGSPWTLAAYMIEGQSAPQFPQAFALLKEDPTLLHHLLAILSESVSAHLSAQITAGVQAAMIFDTWGGLLGQEYPAFSLHYLKQIVTTLKAKHPTTPLILFTKGGKAWLNEIAQTGCDVVSLDAEVDMKAVRAQIGKRVALQGNLDPAMLLQTPECIEAQVSRILTSYGTGSGHIFNLGHGVTPNVPPENVKFLVDIVHQLSQPFH